MAEGNGTRCCSACGVSFSARPRGRTRTGYTSERCIACVAGKSITLRTAAERIDAETGWTICVDCTVAKPPEGYYLNSKRSTRRTRCIDCCRARSRAQNKPKRSAISRAEYHRRVGRTSAPYVPRAERERMAAEKRTAREAARVERQSRPRKPAIGSKEWLALASQSDIDAYRMKARENYRIRYAARGDEERARARAYKHANPGVAARYGDRRKQRAAEQADGSLTRDAVGRLFAAATVCPYCSTRMVGRDKTLDHMTPLSRGGLHGIANVLVCCRKCNQSKRDRPVDEWLESLDEAARRRLAREFVARFGAPPQQQALGLVWA